MSYQKLLQTVLQHGPAEVAAMQAALNRATDFTDPRVVQVAQQLPDFEQIFHEVNALSAVERSRFLVRLSILAEREKTTIPRFSKPTMTNPTPSNDFYFKRRDVVRCQFGGVGSEPDEPHFGVVWYDNNALTDLVVIPTTSQFDTEYPGEFSIGQLVGLPAYNTILQVHKMMNISRKRIVQWNGNFVISRIPSARMERIFHAIAILYDGETSLDSFIYGNPSVGVMLPDNLTQFETMRFWPIRDMQVNPANQLLTFRKWNETTSHSLQLKVPNQIISMDIKKNIWKKLYGKTQDQDRTLAMQLYRQYY